MLNNFFEITDEFNFETEKQNFVQNLDMLKSMSVQESTLYKKWQEFNKDEYKMRTKAHKFDIIKSKLCLNKKKRMEWLQHLQVIMLKVLRLHQH